MLLNIASICRCLCLSMLPKLNIANCYKYGLQLVYHTVFYVGSNCKVWWCWKLSLYVCDVLSVSVVVISKDCSISSVWTLISNWLGYLMWSLVYPHICESSTHLNNRNSRFTQWGQLIVQLTYCVRETFQGQCPAMPILLVPKVSLVHGH